MSVAYSEIAARGLERIGALSDGVFAVAMTLIVLEIHIPDPGPIHSEGELLTALAGLAPRLVTYGLSFLTLGIFWSGQQTQLNHFARGNRDLAWIHLAFLALVALMPFSTSLLAEFITFRLALVIYWANIFLLGVLIYASWAYARHADLVKEDTSPHTDRAIKRRILIAQPLYAFGAALCLISTYWSIAFIVLVQLNFAIGPRIRAFSRI